MISKKEAIEILEDYLHHEFAVDPIHNYSKRKANLPSIRENDFCWLILDCKEEDVNKIEIEGTIGGGPYFIDKTNGNIYSTGSAPLNWEQDFINFKLNKETQINWVAKKNSYLACKTDEEFKVEYREVEVRCKFDEKDRAVESFFKNYTNKSSFIIPPVIINKPFHTEEGVVIIGLDGARLKESIKIAFLNFKDGIGLDNYNKAVWDLKKFLRVSNIVAEDDLWVSVTETNLEQPIESWNLNLCVEIT